VGEQVRGRRDRYHFGSGLGVLGSGVERRTAGSKGSRGWRWGMGIKGRGAVIGTGWKGKVVGRGVEEGKRGEIRWQVGVRRRPRCADGESASGRGEVGGGSG